MSNGKALEELKGESPLPEKTAPRSFRASDSEGRIWLRLPLPTYPGGEGWGEGGLRLPQRLRKQRPPHPDPLPRSAEGEGTKARFFGRKRPLIDTLAQS